MTDEERRRTINFIIMAQAKFPDDVRTETREDLQKMNDERLEMVKSNLVSLRFYNHVQNLFKLERKAYRQEQREWREKVDRLNVKK